MINIMINLFFNFYFLNVHISLTMYVPNVKFCISILDITIEGSVSQNIYISPSSFFYKILKKYF